jgi:hypothetical protein
MKYIDHLQHKNADDLAFYPLTTLEKAYEENRIIVCKDNAEFAGYIWHGPARVGEDIVIYQACVDYESRRRHLGWGMVKGLIEIAKAGGGRGIRLRCASSSQSNEFWKLIGFYCTRVTKGGVKRSREINHWRTDIQTPLFTVDEVEPSSVAIDLKSYQRDKKSGVEMANRFSRNHY